MASIKPLSETVLSNVRSGFIISSLANVVEELVYNSLDAGARKVSVLVGINNGYIKVEDDGSGINRDGLMLLGERYATSKGHYLDKEDDSAGTFGFRGEVLCSIADISLLEIITKIQGSPNGYRKVMKGRTCLFLSIDDKQDVGTTVVVRDLFYNQPVRRRQLQSSTKKVLHSVRECVMRIALVLPKVAFRVVDAESEDEMLCTHACPSPLSLLCSNFGIESSNLCKLNCSEGFLKLTGYVSSPSSLLSSKAIQYIYVNSRFVVKGPMHKALSCLADMCWDRFRGDKGGKRTQSHAGPSYCLNLTCPRTSYDLNLEISGTSIEFKDWAPVIRFIEKSVALFWSKKKKKGDSSNCELDETQTYEGGNVVEDLSSSRKDWQLKSCEATTKRRRMLNSQNGKASSEDLFCTEMQVEDERSSSSVWHDSSVQLEKAQAKSGKYTEPDTEKDYPLCGYRPGDDISECLHLDENRLQSEMGFTKTDDNCAETNPSRTGWKDEMLDNLVDGSNDLGSGFSFGYIQDHDENEDNHRHKELLLRSPPWDHKLKSPPNYSRMSTFPVDKFEATSWKSTGIEDVDDLYRYPDVTHLRSPPQHHKLKSPPNYSRMSTFQVDKFEATSWESTGRGDVDNPGRYPDVSHLACHRTDVADMWLPSKLGLESRLLNDLNTHSLPSCERSSYMRPNHWSEKVSEYPLPGFDPNYQRSAISYPSANINEWDLDHLVMDDGAQRSSELRKCYGVDVSDEKEDFSRNIFGVRFMDETLSPPTFSNSELVTGHNYAEVEKETLELPGDVCSFDDKSSTAYDDLLARETNSSSPDIGLRILSSYWSPSETKNIGVQMNLRRCQTLEQFDSPRGRSPTCYHKCSPDKYVFTNGDDILTAMNVPPSLNFRSKFNLYEPSGQGASRFVCEDLKSDLMRCLPVETNHISSAHLEKSIVRTRRSHSAPPVYPGKRRFLSVGDCLTHATENPVLPTDPQAHSVSVKAMLKHSCVPTPYDDYRKDDEMSSAKDPHIYTDHQLKGDLMIPQDSVCSLHVKAGDSDNEKEVQDLESSRVKWREGCHDTALKRNTSCRSVGDRLDEHKGILDVQACMLYLAGDSIVPKSINRNCLEGAKVLSQVDNKFIPVVGSGILAVIDQHAADERIRLEEMRQKVLSGELVSITYLEEEKELVLPEIGYQLLCNYAESIKNWGWICNIFSLDTGSFSKNLNLLNDQATHLRLLAVPCILGVKLSDTDLLEYLQQLADTDGSSTLPPSVIRVLNYKACRGAIMFGDKLLPSECALIVEELKGTSLCFQCAHGRPTTVPLVNLNVLHKWTAQLGTSRDSSKPTWHGLCRNSINLERAKHRLAVARGS